MSSFYLPIGSEVEVFSSSFRERLPVMIKGPTGCGKTRFVEYMAEQLNVPLITVPCHEDLTAADLIGRYLLEGGNTVWVDGPMTRAVREGAICYLDEVVEARADTTVVIHPLADHRRELNIERLGESLKAPDNFMLVMSYNPGYQSVLKDLKPSTRQRMVGLELDYPEFEQEVRIVTTETGVDETIARELVKLGNAIRKLDVSGMPEVSSTRTLITAARLIVGGLSPAEAAKGAIIVPLTDDAETSQGLHEIIASFLG
ncbi:MAG: CbbQ/NirQ/NorQ/GpvN family protein [Porticoccaceae bacterium]|nr:CbbQ/NirQ/NorQ/GpvN family protein [Pseudomonadales bacterium]MCP5172320.1 CbbQ/NirQ/NorQ/GpvN family protein [Pseudomonadales bacterium]